MAKSNATASHGPLGAADQLYDVTLGSSDTRPYYRHCLLAQSDGRANVSFIRSSVCPQKPTSRLGSSTSMSLQASPAQDDVAAMLRVAIDAARKAGAHMREHIQTARVEKTKSSKDDLVTIVDKQCQDVIFATIAAAFPSHELLGEEDVAAGSEASAVALEQLVRKDWLWIVDPIDGTTNFVHKRPASVVSVACAHKGEVVVGVIYDPYRDELFSTQKGEGAFCNGERIAVSSEATFSEALIGFGIGTKDSVRLPMLDCAREFSGKCRGLRLQGASALELAWTCCGRQTVSPCPLPWDLMMMHCLTLSPMSLGLLRAGSQLMGHRGWHAAGDGGWWQDHGQRGQTLHAQHAQRRGIQRRARRARQHDRAHRAGRRCASAPVRSSLADSHIQTIASRQLISVSP